jgi:pyridoxine 5-phosphate synthase
MTKLSVNINKIATLRNARGENNPDLLHMALLIEELADGITVHPRPDERHIKKADVYLLKKHLTKEFNIEGYPSDDFINLMLEIRPEQITLVPDPPGVLTSDAGFKLKEDLNFVKDSIKRLRPTGARISIFIDPKDFIGRESVIQESGADRIELYTKSYADNMHKKEILNSYKNLAYQVKDQGLGLNAGHDLSLENLGLFLKEIPIIDEVSIGHAIICDALILGLAETVRKYKDICKNI